MRPEERAKFLGHTHSFYRHYQQEDAVSVLMAELGHPHRREYFALRAFFDTLRYSSNQSARVFAFKDPRNSADYWAPALNVRGLRAYPASWEDFEAELREKAPEGWGKLDPYINHGSWKISTTDERFHQLLYEERYDPRDARRGEEGWDYQIFCRSQREVFKIRNLVKRFLRRYVVQPRTMADDRADQMPLSLAKKPLSYGGGEEVTVTDHAILIPLMPFGEKSQRIAANIVEGLLKLVDQGYPWAPVREKIAPLFADKKTIKELDRRYA